MDWYQTLFNVAIGFIAFYRLSRGEGVHAIVFLLFLIYLKLQR